MLREARVGAGVDIIHEKGMPVAVGTWSVASVLVWSHNAGIALAYPFGRPVGLNAAAGGILVKNLNDEVGTHGNFYGKVSYCVDKACLSFSHISHGARVFGIRSEDANYGLNFLFLEYRYR
jgi:hypothetical protein